MRVLTLSLFCGLAPIAAFAQVKAFTGHYSCVVDTGDTFRLLTAELEDGTEVSAILSNGTSAPAALVSESADSRVFRVGAPQEGGLPISLLTLGHDMGALISLKSSVGHVTYSARCEEGEFR